MTIKLVYMTAGSRPEAEKVAETLVNGRLAACVNIIGAMTSVYEWKGAVQKDSELVVIAKTTEAQVPELIAAVKAVHSYECPCIVTLPVTGGHAPFLDWIAQQVDSPPA
jgi:periplasmic divalent cation tolerance protein